MGLDDTSTQVPLWLAQAAEETIASLEPPLERTRLGRPAFERSIQTLQFEDAFLPLMDAVAGGSTLDKALKDHPVALDLGAFNQWIQKDAERKRTYDLAKAHRAEVWAGRMIETAEGVDASGQPLLEDVARSRLKIDTYKWLMGADNRKTYGETKQIEVSQTISITAALDEARSRREAFMTVIEGDYRHTPSIEQHLLESSDGGTGE